MITLNHCFEEFVDPDSESLELNKAYRYLFVYGGRGGGKSHFVAEFLVLTAYFTRQKILCAREFQNSIDDSVLSLLKEKIEPKWMFKPRVIYPDYERVTYQATGWEIDPVEPVLTAKFIFLIGCGTISYAEAFLGYIEGYGLGAIVGEPTAGANGNLNFFYLPGGYRVNWTGMKVLKHDGSQHHGVGIIPHVHVKRTIAGIRAGRDEVLEKAVEIAKQPAKNKSL